jgi:hypothetical protein
VAQGTTTRRNAAGSSRSPSSRRRNGNSRQRASSNTRRSSPGKERTNRSTASRRRSAQASNGVGRVEGAKSSVTKGARAAGQTAGRTAKNIGSTAKKLKTPMIAGGATLAGLAGGLAVAANRNSRRKVLGVAMPQRSNAVSTSKNLASVAQQVALATQRLSELTTEVRRVREETTKSKHRSPVEILLEGLTSRRVRA